MGLGQAGDGVDEAFAGLDAFKQQDFLINRLYFNELAVTADPAPGHSVLVNVTPLGMRGADAEALSFSPAHIEAATTVFDVVAFPSETPLIRAARAADRAVITGAEVIALQAARQFARYTGVTPTPEQVARASEFSRAEA